MRSVLVACERCDVLVENSYVSYYLNIALRLSIGAMIISKRERKRERKPQLHSFLVPIDDYYEQA